MDQWRSHIPSNNLRKQFYEWSFEQGDQKSQQNELELVLELDGDFFGRKKKCVGAGISGGEPPWAHEAGGAPRGVERALHPDGQVVDPLLCSQCQLFSNILEKIIFKFQGIWRTFIFGVFLYCTDNQITDRKIFIFILFNISNIK